jgi:hypothetical protein
MSIQALNAILILINHFFKTKFYESIEGNKTHLKAFNLLLLLYNYYSFFVRIIARIYLYLNKTIKSQVNQ